MVISATKVLGGLPESKSQNDDDQVDRLNHRYTSSILIMFSIIISTAAYVGQPLKCWPPKHFSKPWIKYVHSYCWVKGTHYVPLEPDVKIPREHEEKDIIPYYQWLPFMLLAQALMFYVPCIIWRMLNSQAGVDVSSIIKASEVFHNTQKIDQRKKTLDSIVAVLDRYFTSGYRQRPTPTFSLISGLRFIMWPVCGTHKNNFLVVLYLFIKILYIINAIGQLFLLNVMLDTDFHAYGIDVIQKSLAGEEWAPSTRFPRVTMCDFKVRRLGDNIHRYVVQCALPVNLFNERVFLIIWFWLVFVAAVSCYSFLSWLFRGASVNERHRYISKHLMLQDIDADDVRISDLIHFVQKYLGPDGVIILKLISNNTDAYTVVDITRALWAAYCEKHKDDDRRKNNDRHKDNDETELSRMIA